MKFSRGGFAPLDPGQYVIVFDKFTEERVDYEKNGMLEDALKLVFIDVGSAKTFSVTYSPNLSERSNLGKLLRGMAGSSFNEDMEDDGVFALLHSMLGKKFVSQLTLSDSKKNQKILSIMAYPEAKAVKSAETEAEPKKPAKGKASDQSYPPTTQGVNAVKDKLGAQVELDDDNIPF